MGLFDRLKNKVLDYVDKARDYFSADSGEVMGNVIDLNARIREREQRNQQIYDFPIDQSTPEPVEIVDKYYSDLRPLARKSIEKKLEAKRRDWDSRRTTSIDQKIMAYKNNTAQMNQAQKSEYRVGKHCETFYTSGQYDNRELKVA